jgi:hypothetical protein
MQGTECLDSETAAAYAGICRQYQCPSCAAVGAALPPASLPALAGTQPCSSLRRTCFANYSACALTYMAGPGPFSPDPARPTPLA